MEQVPLGKQLKSVSNLFSRHLNQIPLYHEGENLTPMQRMIIVVVFLTALRGHSCVAHDIIGVLWNTQSKVVSRKWTLIDLQSVIGVIGDSGGIGATGLTDGRKHRQNVVFLSSSQRVAVI